MLAWSHDAEPEPARPGRAPGPAPARGRSRLGRELDRWSARNSSKGAMLSETIECLRYLADGHSVDELHRAVQDRDLLGKGPWEARRTCWRLISWRYLTPRDNPCAGVLAALARRPADDPLLRGALFYHHCLADRLTFDVVSELLWELQRQGRQAVGSAEVEAFVLERSAQHPEVLGWSRSTLDRLSKSILASLRDFGRLAGGANKRLARPPLPDELLLYVGRFLVAEGMSGREVVTAPDFRLWGCTPREIGARLVRLSQAGVVRFEWSGDIAVLDLGEESFEAYARRLGQEVH